jgi:hypothetical protein
MRSLACALCVFALGCSFVASAHRPNGGAACMQSRRPPQVDTVVAASFAAAFVISLVVDTACAARAGADCSNDSVAVVVSGAAALIAGAPFMGSAIYGFEKPTCVDPEAVALVPRSIEAARGGDCQLALALAQEVRDGDPGVYAQLAVDPDVARCAQAEHDAHARDRAERNAWCTARRAEITEKAKTIDDPDERAKLLATMPVCL